MSNLFQKLNNQAAKHGIDPQQYQTLFYLEHVLKQISESPYRDDFILKGGFELASLLGWHQRTTVDIDATMNNHDINAATTTKLLNQVFAASNDDVQFAIASTQGIMEDGEYPGLRVKIDVKYKTAKSHIKIDISTGDVISPKPILLQHHSLLGDGTSFGIMAFPIEQIIADKLVTTLLRDTSNTRAKDYMDLYALEGLEHTSIDPDALATAFQATAKKKGLPNLPLDTAIKRLDVLALDPGLQQQWTNYQAKHDYAAGVSLADTMAAAKRILPIAMAMQQHQQLASLDSVIEAATREANQQNTTHSPSHQQQRGDREQ